MGLHLVITWPRACGAALALALLVACSKKEAEKPPPQASEVSVQIVKAQTVPVTFEFVGQTESSQQVEIRARVSGFLEKRVYTEGSFVKPGQVLFLMDAKPFEASLKAARGELAQQQARLNTARANLARVKPLVADNALAAKDLDDATGQEQAAAAAVEAAAAEGHRCHAESQLRHDHVARCGSVVLCQGSGRCLREFGKQPADLCGQARPDARQLQPVGKRIAAQAGRGREGHLDQGAARRLHGRDRPGRRIEFPGARTHHLCGCGVQPGDGHLPSARGSAQSRWRPQAGAVRSGQGPWIHAAALDRRAAAGRATKPPWRIRLDGRCRRESHPAPRSGRRLAGRPMARDQRSQGRGASGGRWVHATRARGAGARQGSGRGAVAARQHRAGHGGDAFRIDGRRRALHPPLPGRRRGGAAPSAAVAAAADKDAVYFDRGPAFAGCHRPRAPRRGRCRIEGAARTRGPSCMATSIRAAT